MKVMEIQGTPIQIKEYAGQRVVTFKDIDTVHQRTTGTASRNFRANRERFIENVDFYRITEPDELRRLGFSRPQGGVPSDVILITETGYLMLVKSFTDDLAWKVQRELVDSYFRARAEPEEESIQKILDNGVPTVILATNDLIKCAEIMANCLDENRPYVINCLRHVIPDIDSHLHGQPIRKEEPEKRRKGNAGSLPKGVDIDTTKLLLEMVTQNMTLETLASKVCVSVNTVIGWIQRKHKPVLQNRINVCVALSKDDDFLTPKRKRNVEE